MFPRKSALKSSLCVAVASCGAVTQQSQVPGEVDKGPGPLQSALSSDFSVPERLVEGDGFRLVRRVSRCIPTKPASRARFSSSPTRARPIPSRRLSGFGPVSQVRRTFPFIIGPTITGPCVDSVQVGLHTDVTLGSRWPNRVPDALVGGCRSAAGSGRQQLPSGWGMARVARRQDSVYPTALPTSCRRGQNEGPPRNTAWSAVLQPGLLTLCIKAKA